MPHRRPGWFLLFATLAATLQCGGGDDLTLPPEGLPAAIEALDGNGQTGVVGQMLTDSLVIRVTDSRHRPVQGQRVRFTAVTGGSSLLLPDTAETDADGLARTVWVLGGDAGQQQVEARVISPVAHGTLSATFTAVAEPEVADTVVAVAGAGQTGIVNGLLEDSLVVEVTDRFGNPLPGQTVRWRVPEGEGGVSAEITTTGDDGRAGVTRILGPEAGAQSARATVDALPGQVVVFTHLAISGHPVDLVKLSPDQQSAPVGSTLTDSLVVQAQDADGNGVPGEVITWRASTGGSVSARSSVTDAAGKAFTFWTLSPTAGANTLTAAGFGVTIDYTAVGTSSSPDTIRAVSATTFTATAGQPVPQGQRPSVRVSDASGNAVAGVSVTFLVTQGGGTVSDGNGQGTSVAVATGADGIATVTSWTLGPASGSNVVTASANRPGGGALVGSPVSFTATGQAGAAGRLVFGQQPTDAEAGAAISPAVTVIVQDENGNPITGSTVPVSLAMGSNPGSGTLSGTLTVTPVAGVATFANLSIDKSGTGYTLVATAVGLTQLASSAFTIRAAAASQLGFLVQPSNTAAGSTITPAVQVAVQDRFGNTITSSSASVSLALGANPGGGTLSGGGGRAASNGVATFSSLSIDNPGNGYTLIAESESLTQATSAAFDVGVGAAARLAFTVQPSNVAAGQSITPAVQVAFQDGAGNTVTSRTDSVFITLGTNPGGASLTGGRAKAVAGVATFSGLSLDRLGNGYTLVANDGPGGLNPVTSSTFNVVAGSGNKLAFVTQPTNTVVGAAISPAIRVAIQDAAGNTNTTATDSVSLLLTPAGGGLGGTLGARAVSGVATFSGVTVAVAGNGYTLTAFAPLSPLISATSNAFNVTKAASTTQITSDDPDPSTAGQSYTVQFKVTSSGGTPGGSITVSDGSASCSGSLTAGAGSCALTSTTQGGKTLTATYPGDASFNGSSDTESHQVDPAPKTATATSITNQSPNPSNVNQLYRVDFQVTVPPPGTGTPTGSVTVSEGSASCTATVATGFCELASATAGVRTLVATYAGDATFAGSTSAPVDHTVNTPSPTLRMIFRVQPSDARVNEEIKPAVEVAIVDTNGNLMTHANNRVTLRLGNNPLGLASLSGATEKDAKDGVAKFDKLKVQGLTAFPSLTLIASSPGLADVESEPFDISLVSP